MVLKNSGEFLLKEVMKSQLTDVEKCKEER